MAPSIIYNDAALREVFLPGQISVFGGFALRANSLGHLEQINSYAPWPSSQVWKLKVHGGYPRRLDLRRIRATAKRVALLR